MRICYLKPGNLKKVFSVRAHYYSGERTVFLCDEGYEAYKSKKYAIESRCLNSGEFEPLPMCYYSK